MSEKNEQNPDKGRKKHYRRTVPGNQGCSSLNERMNEWSDCMVSVCLYVQNFGKLTSNPLINV